MILYLRGAGDTRWISAQRHEVTVNGVVHDEGGTACPIEAIDSDNYVSLRHPAGGLLRRKLDQIAKRDT